MLAFTLVVIDEGVSSVRIYIYSFKTQPEPVPKMQPRFSAGKLTRDPGNVDHRSNRHEIRSEKSKTFHSLFNGNLQSVLRMIRKYK